MHNSFIFCLSEANLTSLSLFEIASKISETIIFISFSFIHLVVIAAVQTLIPDGSKGFLGSYGIIFLFTLIQIFSRVISTSFQVTPKLPKTSTNIK